MGISTINGNFQSMFVYQRVNHAAIGVSPLAHQLLLSQGSQPSVRWAPVEKRNLGAQFRGRHPCEPGLRCVQRLEKDIQHGTVWMIYIYIYIYIYMYIYVVTPPEPPKYIFQRHLHSKILQTCIWFLGHLQSKTAANEIFICKHVFACLVVFNAQPLPMQCFGTLWGGPHGENKKKTCSPIAKTSGRLFFKAFCLLFSMGPSSRSLFFCFFSYPGHSQDFWKIVFVTFFLVFSCFFFRSLPPSPGSLDFFFSFFFQAFSRFFSKFASITIPRTSGFF